MIRTEPLVPARFYPIVPDLAWLKRLVPLGVTTIQLRMKDCPASQVREDAAAALALARANGCRLILNDYWEVALAIGCDAVHLGQEDLRRADLERLRSAGVRFGISTHSEQELDVALAEDPDYVALGPIYPTLLKQMPWRPQGLARIAQWRLRLGSMPLVAIGGLTPERAAGALQAGADSLAVITDFLTHSDPEMRVRQWLETVGKASQG